MKNSRQVKISELISRKNIYNQQELQKELEEMGVFATQPTLSRDINDMGLIKIRTTGGKYKYSVPNATAKISGLHSLFLSAVQSIQTAMNMVIIKCKTGMAQATCATIDEMEFENVVGTISGDDTIFIATKDTKTANKLKEELSTYLT